MTTIYKLTLWVSKGHPTPLEIVFMGHEADTVALKSWSRLVGGNYSHGHLISYEAESPNIVPDVVQRTVHRSFDIDYMDYGDDDYDGDDDWDDDDWESEPDYDADDDPEDDEEKEETEPIQ